MSHIIGIGGISQSGKSTLTRRIKDKLPHQNVLILEMDDFVFPEADIPKINNQTDWDRPESMNFESIISKVKESIGHYDLIIVEGILAFAHEPLKDLFDTTIFLEIAKESFLARRMKETRWGKEEKWYWEHVWESYLKFGKTPSPDLVISGEKEIEDSILIEIIQKAGLKGVSTY